MNFRNFISRVLCLYLIGIQTSFAFATSSRDWQFNRLLNDKENLIGACEINNTSEELIPFLNVTETMEFNSCFKNKSSFSMLGQDYDGAKNLELLKGDLNICNCLDEKAQKNENLAQALKKGSVAKIDVSKIPEKIQENYESAIQENGKMVFDASLMCNQSYKNDSTCISLFFSDNVKGFFSRKKQILSDVSKSLELRTGQPIHQRANDTLDIESEEFEQRKKIYEDYKNKMNSTGRVDAEKYAQSLIGEQPLKPGQCVTGREFIAFNQKKSFENVASELASLDLGNFNTEDWDYRKLRKKYDYLMSQSPNDKKNQKTEIDKIKNKLIFLNYNPLVKTFLTIDPLADDKIEELANTLHNNRAGVPFNFYKKDNILNKKKDLLSVLKSYALGNQTGVCTIDNTDCMGNVTNPQKLDEFNKSLRDFFVRQDIGRATKKQSTDLSYEILFKKNEENNNTLPLTQRALYVSYMKDFPDMNPDECAGGGVNPERCPLIYGGYCKKIKSIEGRITSSIQDSVPDELDTILKNSFNPDISTNGDLQAFNKEVCEKKIKIDKNQSISFNDYKKSNCSDIDLNNCFNAYYSKAKAYSTTEIQNFVSFQKSANLKGISNSSEVFKTASKKSSDSKYDDWDDWNKVRDNYNLSRIANDQSTTLDLSPTKKSIFDSSGIVPQDESTVKKDDSSGNMSNPGQMPFIPDYSISSPGDSVAQDKDSEKQKIENMTDERKKSLLNDWENEYDEWKKSKMISESDDLSPADSVKDSKYRKEIETLRALLEEQKKLTETQSKLLNEAIARRDDSSSTVSDKKSVTKKEKSPGSSSELTPSKISNSSFSNTSSDSSSRSPASIGDGGRIGNNSTNSNAVRSGFASNKSFARTSENADSLAREEAKLVNVKKYSDGSILVDSSGSSNSTVNAISLPVTDEQYKVLLINPTGLSLNQIEKSIPPEQISKLEKSGEIILLLKNGNNPPFEVKVARVDNKLVYSLKDKDGKDQVPVKRVFTRQALESQLKVQR
jgi:hypothetical protein